MTEKANTKLIKVTKTSAKPTKNVSNSFLSVNTTYFHLITKANNFELNYESKELPSEHILNRHVFKNISHCSPEQQKTTNGNNIVTCRQHGFNLFAHVY